MKLKNYIDDNQYFLDYGLEEKISNYINTSLIKEVIETISNFEIDKDFVLNIIEETIKLNSYKGKRDIKTLITVRDKKNNANINNQHNLKSFCWRWCHKHIDVNWIPYDYALKVSLCRKRNRKENHKIDDFNYIETLELWFSINKDCFYKLSKLHPELINDNLYV